MPQYLFMIYDDEAAWEGATDADWQAAMEQHNAFAAAVKASGASVVAGEALSDTSTATTVRPRKGEPALVTDGPFAETKEALSGYYVIDAPDLDAALALAPQCPTSGCIEVRPVLDLSQWS